MAKKITAKKSSSKVSSAPKAVTKEFDKENGFTYINNMIQWVDGEGVITLEGKVTKNDFTKHTNNRAEKVKALREFCDYKASKKFAKAEELRQRSQALELEALEWQAKKETIGKEDDPKVKAQKKIDRLQKQMEKIQAQLAEMQ